MDKDNLIVRSEDPLLNFLNKIIVYSVKLLAVMIVIVILWTLVHVVFHLYHQILATINQDYDIENVFSALGTFMAVLIAVEIYLNIVFFLEKHSVYVPLVLATALTAVARKVIILDYATLSSQYIYATSSVIMAVGLSYWLITKKET